MRKYQLINPTTGEEAEAKDEQGLQNAFADGFKVQLKNGKGEEAEASSLDGIRKAYNDGFEPVMSTSNVSKIESGLRGAAQGISMGFADEITGGLEAAADTLFGDKKFADFKDTYKQRRDESRSNYNEAEEANPLTYNAGQVGGAIATAAVPGMGGVTLGKLAAQGALQGLGNSEADLTEGDLAGAAKDTAIGGAIGGATGAIGNKVAPMIGRAATKGANAVENAALEVATNPMVEKAINTTDVTGRVSNVATNLLKKVGGELKNPALNKGADLIAGGLGRKVAYSNPLTGAVQGLSDAGRVAQKGAYITAENLPKIMHKLGKYGPVLKNAAERGSQSLAATNFVLQQTDPEYRKLVLGDDYEQEDQ